MNFKKLIIGYFGIILFWILTFKLEIFPKPETLGIEIFIIVLALVSSTIYNTYGILNILVKQGIKND